jgi:hypothetical protein
MLMLTGLNEQERKEITDLLRQTGSSQKDEALAAQTAFAAALQEPLRSGIVAGDTIAGIFAPQMFDPNARIEYPIDFYRPDNAAEFTAFVIPNQGKIPQRQIEGDYVTVPTYDIGAGIDWLLRYAREARWDIVSRALEVLEAGFTKKMNDDGWHTLLAAGYDRNIVVSDPNASAGQFTKRLVSLMKLVMRRNAGGNSGSTNRGKLTNLFVSPEAIEDIRNWGVDQADDLTRREIFVADDEGGTSIYGVKISTLDELGESQEYQTFYQNTIAAGASNSGMASGDVELVVGLDLSKTDAFVMPVRESLQVFVDESLHRERREGFYSWASLGFACLNGMRVLLGSL